MNMKLWLISVCVGVSWLFPPSVEALSLRNTSKETVNIRVFQKNCQGKLKPYLCENPKLKPGKKVTYDFPRKMGRGGYLVKVRDGNRNIVAECGPFKRSSDVVYNGKKCR